MGRPQLMVCLADLAAVAQDQYKLAAREQRRKVMLAVMLLQRPRHMDLLAAAAEQAELAEMVIRMALQHQHLRQAQAVPV